MMADKAMIESGRDKRREGSGAALWRRACAMPPSAARSRSLNLKGFKAVLKSRLKAFRQLLCATRDAANAVTPYFIHIVRANRTDDMVGSCPGIGQAGRQEKQTVAG
jgi:hypothetical protein